eukprot:9311906-Pyramimonas_sp.AAC.1
MMRDRSVPRSRSVQGIRAWQDCLRIKKTSAGKPAIARLGTYSANVAEGSGENLPAVLGLRSVANMRAILILSEGNENMVISSADMCGLLHGKGR